MLRIDNEVIAKTLAEAKRLFVPGKENIKKVLSSTTANSTRRSNGCLLDANIPYNATLINSNIVAAKIPTYKNFGMFIYSLLLNTKFKAQKIIALGPHMGQQKKDNTARPDFYDCCILPPEKQNIYKILDQQYQVNIETAWEKPGKFWQQRCWTEEVLQTRLTVKPAFAYPMAANFFAFEADVTFITNHDDNEPLIIEDKYKDLYWELYQQSLSCRTVVLCADGATVTGQLILLFEILRNFDSLFRHSNPAENAKSLIELLVVMRQDRPGLVDTFEHFEHTVKNACMLHQHKTLQMVPLTRSVSAPLFETGNDKIYGLFKENFRRHSISQKRLLAEIDASESSKDKNSDSVFEFMQVGKK